MKVGILTSFAGIDEAYSICRVVDDQIKMLTSNGIEVKLFVKEGFKAYGIWEQVELFEMPHIGLGNYHPQSLPENFEENILKLKDRLMVGLQDVKVCLTHDMI